MLSVSARRDNDTFIVELAGKMMGGMEQKEFHTLVRDAVEGGCKSAVIDLSDVEWLNSWGVGQLVSAYTTMKNRGGLLVLSGCSPKVMTVLRLTRFDNVFSFEPTVTSALEVCKRQMPPAH